MFQLWHLTAHFQQYLSTFPRLRKRGSVGKYQIGYCCNKPIFHLSQFPKSPKFKSDSLSAIVVMAVLHLREKGAIWRELARSCLKGRQTNLELKGFYKMSKLAKLTKTKTHIGGLGDTGNRGASPNLQWEKMCLCPSSIIWHFFVTTNLNNSADIFCKVPKFQACNKGKDLSTRTLVPISFSRLVGGAAV